MSTTIPVALATRSTLRPHTYDEQDGSKLEAQPVPHTRSNFAVVDYRGFTPTLPPSMTASRNDVGVFATPYAYHHMLSSLTTVLRLPPHACSECSTVSRLTQRDGPPHISRDLRLGPSAAAT